MKKFKNIALTLSLSVLTFSLPYINVHALPIYDSEDKQEVSPLNMFNMENKNIKRNQKEMMAEILVNLYNRYNSIFKQGIEINDIKNSSFYFNITKQKTEIKDLLNDIIEYPYSVVNKEIEQKFLKLNVLFCYLTNNYINNQISSINNSEISNIKETLYNIKDTLKLSLSSLQNFYNNYYNTSLDEDIIRLNNIIDDVYDINSFKSNETSIKEIIKDISSNIEGILEEYIHV